ncbi:translation initiation factor IF-2 [Leptospira sp. GIMC2001]|uniref:translation initiation factor IF-2 n=1 Tax=Leptospira sp. GIMC2001 TaxID=1513297 RepID=UPI00234A5B64|nr:translation initiation factor IF-2 [Leptospira sp. GIMC2001]WCL48089.1 translation initiation factor IF-2 [Leptospira sp. GIMC2001]
MEDHKTIKETLAKGSSDPKKGKIKIKKKESAPGSSEKNPTTSSQQQPPKVQRPKTEATSSNAPKKDLSELYQEESKKQTFSSNPIPQPSKPRVIKQAPSKTQSEPDDLSGSSSEPSSDHPAPVSEDGGDTPKEKEPIERKAQPIQASPFASRGDRNPIISRPVKKPTSSTGGGGYQGGGQGGNRGGNAGTGNRFGGPPNRGGARPMGGGTGPKPVGGGARPIQVTGGGDLIPPPTTGGPNKKKSTGFEKDKRAEQLGRENSKFFKQNFRKSKGPSNSASSVPKEISIMENIQVGELAKKLNLKPGDVIGKLMKMGMMVTINNVIDAETATVLADDYGCKVTIVSLYDETVIEDETDAPEDMTKRPPVVTIMGHVDHGKTKLLDTIRSSRVAESESGGITQHIGAYQVRHDKGTVTFLDTPGHEAFTSMRARGAKITDIVILVVAADDSVKPQTVEAIAHAKEAEVPIIVAINKIDLPAANVEKVKQDLASLGLQPEDWGGTTICCEISAKNNIGIDHLLDMILLQADVMDLRANQTRRAKGTIIEARLDPGRGPVATLLIQTGTLKIGDPFVAGTYSGRVRAMFDDIGKNVQEAGPSAPVLVTGLEAVPEAGAPFDSVKDEKEARIISQSRKEYERVGQAGKQTRVTLDTMNDIIKQGDLKELKVIIKADVRGSAEAVKEALEKLSTGDVRLTVIHAGTGAIVDTDVMLASASNAILIGFHTRANPKTVSLAEKEKVEIKYYSIIYDVVNEIKSSMEGLLDPDKIEKIIGTVDIREIFKITRVGNIAGCMVTSGKITRNSSVRVVSKEKGEILFEGKLKTLKRMKDEAAEVVSGFECGILLDGFNDFEVGDTIEVYEINEIAKKL